MENIPSPPPSRDAEHLNLLAVFHYVVGGIGFFFACFPLIHLFFGIAMITGALDNHKGEAPPAFVGYFFVIIAAFFILMGWGAAACTVISGRLIAKRKRRMFSFVLGAILCVFMPFGTVLGVFTIIVLNKDSVKELYAKAA